MVLKSESFGRLCRARDLLSEVQERPLSIHDVAREVEISPFHFIRQFDAVFGETPHQFRMRARLDLAKHLLALGQHSVTDVCMAVGFSSLGSFSALFRRDVGTTPSAYRRRMRAMVQVTPGCLTLMAGLPASAFRNSREA
jgi:AraC-like DNA-binding protein